MILSAKLSVGCTIGRYSLEKNADFFQKKVCFLCFLSKIGPKHYHISPILIFNFLLWWVNLVILYCFL